MWSGPSYGPNARPHGMNIDGGNVININGEIGRTGSEYIPCSSCHTLHNSELPHGPPGALKWWLPDPVMQWFDKSSGEICAQIKDKSRNGKRDIGDLVEHIRTDPRVQWGWAPGPGREPPPYSALEVAEFLRRWDAAGAPCPTN
jgi:hypothetical protein